MKISREDNKKLFIIAIVALVAVIVFMALPENYWGGFVIGIAAGMAFGIFLEKHWPSPTPDSVDSDAENHHKQGEHHHE